MNLRTARAFANVHRFELLGAIAVPLFVGIFGLITVWRLDNLGVSEGCVRDWLITGDAGRSGCTALMQRWGEIATGGGINPFFLAMGVVPPGAGLLAGAPIIASELEAGTAAFSWWLFPSRVSWLFRQTAVVALPLIVAFAFAALAGDLVAARDHDWGLPAFDRIGLHGGAAVARGAAALAIAILVGAILGRTLPGFVVAGFVLALVVGATTIARDAWIATLPSTVIGRPDPVTGEIVLQPRAVFSAWGMDGDVHVMLGVSEEAAMGWEPLETVLYAGVAVIALAGAAGVLRNRRPR